MRKPPTDGGRHDAPRGPGLTRRPRVAYVMTTFPALSEAFTLNEMAVVQEEGFEVVPVSLTPPSDPLTHADAKMFGGRSI